MSAVGGGKPAWAAGRSGVVVVCGAAVTDPAIIRRSSTRSTPGTPCVMRSTSSRRASVGHCGRSGGPRRSKRPRRYYITVQGRALPQLNSDGVGDSLILGSDGAGQRSTRERVETSRLGSDVPLGNWRDAHPQRGGQPVSGTEGHGDILWMLCGERATAQLLPPPRRLLNRCGGSPSPVFARTGLRTRAIPCGRCGENSLPGRCQRPNRIPRPTDYAGTPVWAE